MINSAKSALAVTLVAILTGCGGGGGGGNDPDTDTGTDTGGQSSTLLPCINSETSQCSGGTSVLTENSVTMTESGVQVYGRSTSDLVAPSANPDTTSAWGLEPVSPDSGGIAEVRLQKNSSGAVTRVGLLLTDIGISWDGENNRPRVIEIFSPKQGRATLNGDANRSIMFGPLPPSSNLDHYDWAVNGAAGTQANYANNVYFPRSEPIRCPAADTNCSRDYSEVAPKLKFTAGPWRQAGQTDQTAADETTVTRLHEDGDLRAGDDVPGPNGERRWISDSDGFGVSYPGFKGYRSTQTWGYRHVSLSSWLTQDTVEIVEWSGGANEHNKSRRGFVAFGNVTPEASIPTGGTATYTGAIYGYFAPTAIATSEAENVSHFRGLATISVNFADPRTATITFTDTRTYNGANAAVPSSFTVTADIGGANAGPANFLSGGIASGGRQGGIGARFFGPANAVGPAEIGGSLSFTYTAPGSGARQTVIGGFIARRQ